MQRCGYRMCSVALNKALFLMIVAYGFGRLYLHYSAICTTSAVSKSRSFSLQSDQLLGSPHKLAIKEHHEAVLNVAASISLYKQTCLHPPHGYSISADNLKQPWTQFSSVTAIIYFNHDHYDVIPYLELLYSSLFPSVVYCGPSPLRSGNRSSRPWLQRYNIRFITYHNNGLMAGNMFYQCMSKVMQQDLARRAGAGDKIEKAQNGAEGYITFPDDMLLFPHRIPYLDRRRIWYWPHNKLRRLDIATRKECEGGSVLGTAAGAAATVGRNMTCQRSPDKWTWPYYFQHAKFHDFWLELNTTTDLHTKRYRDNLVDFLGAPNRIVSAWADVFYVPRELSNDYIRMSAIAARHRMILGSAVAAILVAISKEPGTWERFTGFTAWGDERKGPWRHFRGLDMISMINADYYHPIKWGFMLQGHANMTSLYCNTALPVMYSDHGRF